MNLLFEREFYNPEAELRMNYDTFFNENLWPENNSHYTQLSSPSYKSTCDEGTTPTSPVEFDEELYFDFFVKPIAKEQVQVIRSSNPIVQLKKAMRAEKKQKAIIKEKTQPQMRISTQNTAEIESSMISFIPTRDLTEKDEFEKQTEDLYASYTPPPKVTSTETKLKMSKKSK
jgi:hypothetical protein